MRITSTPATEVTTHPLSDGGTMTVTPDGSVCLGTTTYAVQRNTYVHPGADIRTETHIIGPKGSVYLLRPFIERGGDTGLRQVISLNTGAALRRRGNEVRVIEIAGVIEQLS